MKKVKHLKLISSLLVFLFTISYVSAQTQGTRPNIIVILADDLGYADVGFNRDGSFPSDLGIIPTPNLDNLANNGIIATNAHVAHPFCGPSRAAIMTGIYPHRIGAQYNLPNDITTDLGVPTDTYVNESVFFPEVIKATSYNTAAYGKWHLGFEEGKYQPLDHGFDEFFGFLGGGKPYTRDKYDNTWYRNPESAPNYNEAKGTITNEYQDPLWRDRGYVDRKEFEITDYLTDILTDEAIDFIDRKSGETDPFMMYLSYNAPHTPLEAPADEIAAFKLANAGFETAVRNSSYMANSAPVNNINKIEKDLTTADPNYPSLSQSEKDARILAYQNDLMDTFTQNRITYATMVTNMDANIGRIVTELKKDIDVFNNTVIIFLSDNGGYTFSKGAVNYPLAALKGSVDEGGHKVPFFVHWPDKITTPGTYKYQISSMDLFPTLVNLAGGTIPVTKTIDGVDFMDKMIAGEDARPGEVLHVLRPQNGFHNAAIISYPYRMVRKGGNGSWKLYYADVNPEQQLTGTVDGRPVSEIIAELEAKGADWAREFKDVKPEWFDHERGAGHPHRIHWFGVDNNGKTGPIVFPGYDKTYNDPSLGINNAFNKTYQVYPNPATEKFNIKFDKNINNLDIELVSITGNSVKKIELKNTNSSSIDATNLSSGLYIIRIKADNDLTLEKVIKL